MTTGKKLTPKVPIVFDNWSDARAYLAQHLEPVRISPRGRPIYDVEQIKQLNIRLPD